MLQLKRGSIRPAYFQEKYGVDVRDALRRALWHRWRADGYLAAADDDVVALTREALLRVDVAAATASSCPSTRQVRYT